MEQFVQSPTQNSKWHHQNLSLSLAPKSVIFPLSHRPQCPRTTVTRWVTAAGGVGREEHGTDPLVRSKVVQVKLHRPQASLALDVPV